MLTGSSKVVTGSQEMAAGSHFTSCPLTGGNDYINQPEVSKVFWVFFCLPRYKRSCISPRAQFGQGQPWIEGPPPNRVS